MRKLFVCIALGLTTLTGNAASPLWMRDVQISPDGTEIAFCYKGDIYKVPAGGGVATQLTTQPSYECTPIWSPDSKQIAFASDRNGNFDIFIMPATGGTAQRLTTNSASELPSTFTPDGKYILFSASIQDPAQSAMFPTTAMTELYKVPSNGGRTEQVLGTPAEAVCYATSGEFFLYQDRKGFEDEWRKHHTSSITRDIWMYNTKTGKKSEVYSYKIGKNKKGSNGFSQLSVDKKYIYATWDRYYGTDATKEYVYRIAKDGKSAKKLALGRDPQLIDGRIYYLALKSKSEDGMNYSEDTGTVMSMKTDGTDKKKVAQIVNSGDAYRYSLFQSEGKIYYTKENENKPFYDLEGNSYQRGSFAVKDENYLSVSLEAVNDGTYTYRTTGKDRYMQTKLYRTDNRTGKKNLVASFKLGIEKYSVCGNYVFVEANVPYKGADVTEKLAVYCYKADGSSKVKLASWFPAE